MPSTLLLTPRPWGIYELFGPVAGEALALPGSGPSLPTAAWARGSSQAFRARALKEALGSPAVGPHGFTFSLQEAGEVRQCAGRNGQKGRGEVVFGMTGRVVSLRP